MKIIDVKTMKPLNGEVATGIKLYPIGVPHNYGYQYKDNPGMPEADFKQQIILNICLN